jgi:hypothetical protein
MTAIARILLRIWAIILKNLGYRAPPRQNINETRAFKENRFERELAKHTSLEIRATYITTFKNHILGEAY